MSNLLNTLNQLNAKERFFLIGTVLGNKNFSLDPAFIKNINELLGINIENVQFSAMDYHLDWLAAALKNLHEEIGQPIDNKDKMIKGQQEDVDFIFGFEDENNIIHLVMIEAKATTGWKNKQLNLKSDRLKHIFGEYGNNYPKVEPHFIVISPNKPNYLASDKNKGIDISQYPDWMKQNSDNLFWMKLEIPDNILTVTRCECEEKTKSSEDGECFKITKK
jgi:hypothetical protein